MEYIAKNVVLNGNNELELSKYWICMVWLWIIFYYNLGIKPDGREESFLSKMRREFGKSIRVAKATSLSRVTSFSKNTSSIFVTYTWIVIIFTTNHFLRWLNLEKLRSEVRRRTNWKPLLSLLQWML